MNSARHAKAENIFILLHGEDHMLTVEIEDDGEGFSPDPLLRETGEGGKGKRGLGILGMKERALLIGGNLEICSQRGIGTKIRVRIPLTRTEVLHA